MQSKDCASRKQETRMGKISCNLSVMPTIPEKQYKDHRINNVFSLDNRVQEPYLIKKDQYFNNQIVKLKPFKPFMLSVIHY